MRTSGSLSFDSHVITSILLRIVASISIGVDINPSVASIATVVMIRIAVHIIVSSLALERLQKHMQRSNVDITIVAIAIVIVARPPLSRVPGLSVKPECFRELLRL